MPCPSGAASPTQSTSTGPYVAIAVALVLFMLGSVHHFWARSAESADSGKGDAGRSRALLDCLLSSALTLTLQTLSPISEPEPHADIRPESCGTTDLRCEADR